MVTGRVDGILNSTVRAKEGLAFLCLQREHVGFLYTVLHRWGCNILISGGVRTLLYRRNNSLSHSALCTFTSHTRQRQGGEGFPPGVSQHRVPTEQREGCRKASSTSMPRPRGDTSLPLTTVLAKTNCTAPFTCKGSRKCQGEHGYLVNSVSATILCF